MSNILLFINSSLVSFYIIFHTIDFVRVLQFREYRWDRFKDFLNVIEGRKWFYDKWRIIFLIFTFSWIFIRMLPLKKDTSLSLIILILGIGFLISINKKYRSGRLYRPVKTKKAVLLFGAITIPSIVFQYSFLFINLRNEEKLYLLLVSIIFMIIWSFIVWFVFELCKKIYLKFLQKRVYLKMKKHQKLKVIAIVGAIGKSSTKTYLHDLLKSKYKVISPSGNINSEIGIFKFLLKTDLNKFDICILEVGAYRLGEVDFIMKAIKCDFAIYTGFSPQHLALYGSRENILKGDLEVVNHIKENGKLYINIDHDFKNTILEIKKINPNLSIETFSVSKSGDIHPTNIKSEEKGFRFDLKVNNKDLSDIFVPIYHKLHLTNPISAIALASNMGISQVQIRKTASNFKPPKSALRIEEKDFGIIVWDEYNTTFEGMMTSLDAFSKVKNKYPKICIFSGMLELGREKERIYGEVASKMGKICDKVFCITDEAYICLNKTHTRSLLHKIIHDFDKKKFDKFIKARQKYNILVSAKLQGFWIDFLKN